MSGYELLKACTHEAPATIANDTLPVLMSFGVVWERNA